MSAYRVKHVKCNLSEDKELFLSLLLQLAIEYEIMTDSDTDSIDFLPICKFKDYRDASVEPIIDKKKARETQDIISLFCSDETKRRYRDYREQLLSTAPDCMRSLENRDLKEAFFDSRTYSIMLMLNTLLGEWEEISYPKILVYLTNEETGVIDGHVFILLNPDNNLEAISIQQSLQRLSDSECLQKKFSISKTLFTYVFEKVVPMFPDANYIYAFAWKKMSSILHRAFDFATVQYVNDDDFYLIKIKDNVYKIYLQLLYQALYIEEGKFSIKSPYSYDEFAFISPSFREIAKEDRNRIIDQLIEMINIATYHESYDGMSPYILTMKKIDSHKHSARGALGYL